MKRRELLTNAGALAAAAAVAPAALALEPAPVVVERLTTEYLVTFEGQVRELLVWDRPLSDEERADLAVYMENKHAPA